jgi:hypothetical protein
MRRLRFAMLATLFLSPTGCDYFKGPKLALSTAPGSNSTQAEAAKPAVQWPPSRPREQARFHGMTAEQWAKYVEHPDRVSIHNAARALRVLGAEGRPFLVQALDSSNPETRRICLESLTVADLRSYGEEGKRLLVKLAGDRSDLRIRERAGLYIAQWNQTVPAP